MVNFPYTTAFNRAAGKLAQMRVLSMMDIVVLIAQTNPSTVVVLRAYSLVNVNDLNDLGTEMSVCTASDWHRDIDEAIEYYPNSNIVNKPDHIDIRVFDSDNNNSESFRVWNLKKTQIDAFVATHPTMEDLRE